MRVLVAGGAGYVGSKLVPALLARGYEVNVLDLYLYGDKVLKPHAHLKEIKGDIRNLKTVEEALEGCDAVIHLACISNDPSFELDPALGKSINFDAFEPFVQLCKKKKIRRFIYASSSSVYGVKETPHVTEEMPLTPLTDYSLFKARCEEVLLKYATPDFICTILRPATVCGYAPRQRLDVVVNILTNIAFHTGKIQVMGGTQMRPNIHIDDMVEAYVCLLEAKEELIQKEIFNVGYHNHTVLELGNIVANLVGDVEIRVVPTNDNRSYHISSEKIGQKLGFFPRRTIEDAAFDLLKALKAGKLPNALNDPKYYNIKTMKMVTLR